MDSYLSNSRKKCKNINFLISNPQILRLEDNDHILSVACLPTPAVKHKAPNVRMCHSTLWVKYTPKSLFKIMQNSLCNRGKNEIAKRDKGEMFLHYSEETGKSSQSVVLQLKELCVMCHLPLQYNETNLYIHIMLLMTSLTYEIKL